MTMPFDLMTDVTDDALLILFANGDAAAARMLALRLAPRVLSVAARLLSDRTEAEDVTQEAMLRLWRIAPDWRQGEAKVTTWLYRVTVNLCTDRLRRRRGVALEDAPEVEDDAPSVEGRMMDRDRVAALEAALARLPDRQRQAVVLRHIEGLPNPEIAAILGIGVEAVESLTARGKRALAAMLGDRRAELGYEEG
ncbi:RNA polymerase sigma factor [Falsirhodobacter halotolerans]|uniref:RNA polymerase sigma factor n=1 Tax=Falsirhodobacter halotolerans TaxID=1146892 RepID=UPI001FD3B67D|nr:RNA polymerase sigma factor [Falsirhodobacter halotolerans]MCJ8140469.1 RNA polymerase sigma factor [Falsirhodobacter halotolerans]